MLVEYDVLARDHQDANVSFFKFAFVSGDKCYSFFWLEREEARQNNGHIIKGWIWNLLIFLGLFLNSG